MNTYLKSSLVIIAILAIVFLFVRFSGRYILPDLLGTQATNTDDTLGHDDKLLGKKAPTFDLSDITGNRVKMSQFIDHPLVLVFWATWNKESSDQVKIVDDYLSNQDSQSSLVSFVVINSQEDASLAKSFIRRGGYNALFALDTYGDVSERYNIKSLPTTYFIGKDGIVQEIYTGVLSQKMFVDKIEQILK
jgi:cytochrome c biogenesis protein CcmG/thiol:disulfide interchange protein DsbE